MDRFSSLPDDILCHVLSFIPLKNAVQSSILSPRWRYLFASMSTFDFDRSLCLTQQHDNNFKYLVDRILYFPNQVSLKCFRLTGFSWGYDDYYGLSGWICAVLRRGVKEIYLHFTPSYYLLALPPHLFTCQSLVTMKLNVELGDIIMVPFDVCLPNLKTLHLENSVFSDGDSIHRLISGCHVLHDLTFYHCELYNTSELHIQNLSLKILVLYFVRIPMEGVSYATVINAPSLVYFQYTDHQMADTYTSSNMTSLQRADIRICNSDDLNQQSVTNLLEGIRNVRSLYLTIDHWQGISRTLLAFHNLVELALHGLRFDWRGTWIVEFLHCVPNLKTLILDLTAVSAVESCFRSLPEVPCCLLFHLKEIRVSNIDGDIHSFEMIRYFLGNSIVLEKLLIGGMGALCMKTQSSIFKKISRLPTISKKCEVMTF